MPKLFKLNLQCTNEEYKKLKEVLGKSNYFDLKDSLEGALNNWILDMILDQEPYEDHSDETLNS